MIDINCDATAVEAKLQRWHSRHEAYKMVCQSWQDTQERMIPFLTLAEEDLLPTFEKARVDYSWSYATAALYFSATMCAAKATGTDLGGSAVATQKMYSILAGEDEPKRPTEPLTEEIVQQVAAHLSPDAQLLLQIAFHLGQRVGDCAQLQSKNLKVLEPTKTTPRLAAFNFRQGKTTRVKSQFTMHLPLNDTEFKWLTEGWKRLNERQFCFGANLNACVVVMTEIRKELKRINPQLSLLSIRRGGLQAMALEGMSKSTLLHHSRHSRESTLDRYLSGGLLNLQAARERFPVGTPSTVSNQPAASTSGPST
jgi:integrase